MDEKDRVLQMLMREVAKWKNRALEAAKWKNRALEAAEKACFECEQFNADCDKCRIKKIKEEAT